MWSTGGIRGDGRVSLSLRFWRGSGWGGRIRMNGPDLSENGWNEAEEKGVRGVIVVPMMGPAGGRFCRGVQRLNHATF
jgi:hypothetical protein